MNTEPAPNRHKAPLGEEATQVLHKILEQYLGKKGFPGSGSALRSIRHPRGIFAPAPDTVYKFLTPARLTLLRDREVRLTQPSQLNDPFEANPYMETITYEPPVANPLSRLTLWWLLAQAMLIAPSFPLRQRVKVALLAPIVTSRLLKVFRYIEAILVPDVFQELRAFVDRTLGVISFSSTCDQPLLWAHYSDSHRGFAVGFRSDHEFFHRTVPDQPLLGRLLRMEYATRRPKVTIARLDVSRLLLLKSAHWRYEKEWRLVRRLEAADRRETGQAGGHDLYLARFDPQCVREVIYGARIESKTRMELDAILADQRYRHVSRLQAVLASQHYGLAIEPLPPLPVCV